MWPFKSEMVSQRGGKSSGTIFTLAVFYVLFLTTYLYLFPILALEAEHGHGKGNRPKLYKSTVEVPDCVTHIIYVCAVLSVICCSWALSTHFGNSDDATVMAVIRDPRGYKKMWCVGVLCLLACLAPFFMWRETPSSRTRQVADEEDQPWISSYWYWSSSSAHDSKSAGKRDNPASKPQPVSNVQPQEPGEAPPPPAEDQGDQPPPEEEPPPPEEEQQPPPEGEPPPPEEEPPPPEEGEPKSKEQSKK